MWKSNIEFHIPIHHVSISVAFLSTHLYIPPSSLFHDAVFILPFSPAGHFLHERGAFHIFSSSMASSIQSANLLIKFLTTLLLAPLNFIVFFFLDFLDAILCVIYRYLDQFLEGKVTASACYCGSRGDERENPDAENELSETLYGRRNVFRRIALIGFSRRCEDSEKMSGGSMWNRWSDCGCSSCVDGMENGNQKLYVDVRQPPQGNFLMTYCFFVLVFLFDCCQFGWLCKLAVYGFGNNCKI